MASNSILAEIAAFGTAAAEGGGVKTFVNVYHFQRTSPSGTLVKANVEAGFNSSITPPTLAALSVDYTQTYNTCRMLDDALDLAITVPRTGVGARTGDRLPDFASACLRLYTATRGRFARGSKHVGPVAESDTLGDTLVSGALTRFRAIGTYIVSGFTDSDGNVWQSVVVSRLPPAQYKINPCTIRSYQVTSTLLNLTVGTMKRRKVKSLAS